MTTHTPTVPDHSAQVVRVPIEDADDRRYRAECLCGWTSDWLDDDADAEDARQDHQEVTGNSLDRVLNELLDLQDDLARLVIWLADNWTGALPVPYIEGRRPGHPARPLVEVVVGCNTFPLLALVASILNVAPERAGCATWATRTFGHAQIAAYSYTATDDAEAER